MHRLHFHAGEIQEDPGRQHHVVEIAEIRDEPGIQRQLDGLAHRDIADAQQDEDAARNDGTEQAAERTQPRRRTDAAEREQRDEPVNREQDDDGIKFVVGQRLVEALRPHHESQRRAGEYQHGRKPDHHRLPLVIDRGESPARPERLAHPAEHTALVGIGGRQFRRHQRNRHQEHQRREHVVEDRSQPVFRLRGQATQAHDGGDVHDGERHHADDDCLLGR